MAKDNPNNGETYVFRGLPITPAGIQQLILELFAGQTVERPSIVDAVNRAHLERGGAPARVADFPRSVRQALTALKEAGIAENPAQGFWRIKHTEVQQIQPPVSEIVSEVHESPVHAELTLGIGDSSVYLYYYPTYRRDAEHNGLTIWPCKIGRSDRDPINRIYSQASTALPEAPVIGLLLRTSLASQWEHVLHYILALRGRIVEDAPGDEWFNTSPNDVIEIIYYIDPTLRASEQGGTRDPASTSTSEVSCSAN